MTWDQGYSGRFPESLRFKVIFAIDRVPEPRSEDGKARAMVDLMKNGDKNPSIQWSWAMVEAIDENLRMLGALRVDVGMISTSSAFNGRGISVVCFISVFSDNKLDVESMVRNAFPDANVDRVCVERDSRSISNPIDVVRKWY